MEFDIGIVYEWNGEHGLFTNENGDVYRFFESDVKPDDLDAIQDGVEVIYWNDGSVELMNSFLSEIEGEEHEDQ